jgi:hypothetical protein
VKILDFLEKLGLLWTIYFFIQSGMHSTVYFTINSLGAQLNANNALFFSIPGIILFMIGNFYNLPLEKNIKTGKYNNKVFCQKCGFENDIDFVYCPNCGTKHDRHGVDN